MPGVDDDALGRRAAHDGRDHEGGEVGSGGRALRDLAAVVEDVRPRPHLGHPRAADGEAKGPGRADRDDGRGEAAAADLLGGVDRCQAGLTRQALALGVVTALRVHVALVGEHAGELEAGQCRDPLGEVRGARAGQEAEPSQPGIELDQHRDREPSLARDAGDARGDLVRVDRHGDGDAFGEIGEPCELVLSDDRVADEDVLDAGVGHHLGLAELRDLHAGRAGLDLQVRDLGQLVRLRVRSQGDAQLAGHRGGSVDVRAHDVEVEDDLRRVGRELGKRSHPLE